MFDFGGVISTSPFDAFSHYERERGLPEGFLRKVNSTNPNDCDDALALLRSA
jgi:putative hydrolase of the HAD superfamily